MSAPQIRPLNITSFQTIHKNFTARIDNLFDVMNGDNPDVIAGYNETTAMIQEFLQKAADEDQTVRALGGNWSWTTVGITDGWLLNTLRLNRIKRMRIEEINTAGIFEQDRFLFTQCGCTIIELNDVCKSLKRSLKTSGASNGQTIAGLISNNTHGSAIDFGSTPEMVVGLHIIVGPGRHVYLERASQAVVTPAFIQRLGAEHVRDDAIFNAALVSFGSFGFIHGVMIETDPLFLYNVYRKQYTGVPIRELMETLDFSGADFLPKPFVRPWHFQVIINPYDVSKGPYVTVMYKDVYREDYPHIVVPLDKAGPGEDAPVLLGKLTDQFPILTRLIVNKTLQNAYRDIDNAWGTHGEVFSTSLARGRVLSCAIGIPVEHTNTVMEIALRLNDRYSYVGVFACRFVKQTKATLGFTKFAHTCIAEFDSFEAQSTWDFYEALWSELEASDIPYTFHWGKVNNLDANLTRKMYGEKVDEWVKARNLLLPQNMPPVFTNAFMKKTGLDEVWRIV
jgi:FAD/FMN-containing dehydrogenase